MESHLRSRGMEMLKGRLPITWKLGGSGRMRESYTLRSNHMEIRVRRKERILYSALYLEQEGRLPITMT